VGPQTYPPEEYLPNENKARKKTKGLRINDGAFGDFYRQCSWQFLP
jgi:hypothetical protein